MASIISVLGVSPLTKIITRSKSPYKPHRAIPGVGGSLESVESLLKCMSLPSVLHSNRNGNSLIIVVPFLICN